MSLQGNPAVWLHEGVTYAAFITSDRGGGVVDLQVFGEGGPSLHSNVPRDDTRSTNKTWSPASLTY